MRLGEEIVREPVSRLVRIGTKPLPHSVAGADGLDWGALAACESGGRPNAVDPSGTYGGLYQFDPGTWRSLGGSGTAQNAPAAEQTFRAKKLYVQRGRVRGPTADGGCTGETGVSRGAAGATERDGVRRVRRVRRGAAGCGGVSRRDAPRVPRRLYR